MSIASSSLHWRTLHGVENLSSIIHIFENSIKAVILDLGLIVFSLQSELSIIIPTFYPGPIINRCIDSLPCKSDIIIVDNGDDEELKKIISEKKYNYSGIYNLGAKDALYKNEFAILFAKKTHTLHNNYTNINVNKMLKVKRSINMYMDVKKFEKKFKFKLPYIKAEILNEAKSYIKKWNLD